MSKPIKSAETEIDDDIETAEVETEVDDTAEILKDAKELANNDTSEVAENETPEESVRKALEDISKDKGNGGSSEEESKENDKIADAPVAETTSEKKSQKQSAPAAYDPDLIAPARFDLKGKEAFNRAPPEVKKEIHRSIRDLEAKMTEAATKTANIEKEWSWLADAVKPFASEFGKMGLTVPQGVVALLSAQEALTNPKTSLSAYLALGKDLGHDVSALEATANEGSGNIDLSANSQFRALQEENKRLREIVEPISERDKQAQEQRDNAAIGQITEELNSVIHEVDASGRFVNPKLHDASFVEMWKPLVSAIARNDKTVKSWKEAGKKAYDRLTGRSSSSGNQATPSSRNNRSVSSAITVRGRSSAPIMQGVVEESEVPANETPEQSARRALEDLRRGL